MPDTTPETIVDLERDWAHRIAENGEAKVSPGTQPWLLSSLPLQEAQIQAAVLYFQNTSGEQVLSHAAEWLLDNFYLAQQSLRQIREDLPGGFYRQLPKLVAGPLKGYPRVYAIAQKLVAAGNARLNMQQVRRFVTCYQERQPLTTGELWALPIMLRLSILQTLANAAAELTPEPAQAVPTVDAAASRAANTAAGRSADPDELVGSCFTSLRADCHPRLARLL